MVFCGTSASVPPLGVFCVTAVPLSPSNTSTSTFTCQSETTRVSVLEAPACRGQCGVLPRTTHLTTCCLYSLHHLLLGCDVAVAGLTQKQHQYYCCQWHR
jgi:hypothetical protein